MKRQAGLSAGAGRQLTALANPTRRAVYDIIRAKPSSVSTVAAQLPVSQPAVSQHLRVLTGARLVSATPFGAQRIYRADPAGVKDLRAWIDGLWDDVLDAFVEASDSGDSKSNDDENNTGEVRGNE